jgi:hypothetical protein
MSTLPNCKSVINFGEQGSTFDARKIDALTDDTAFVLQVMLMLMLVLVLVLMAMSTRPNRHKSDACLVCSAARNSCSSCRCKGDKRPPAPRRCPAFSSCSVTWRP